MIKRFKEIKEIGVFKNSNFGSCEFGKFTVIYGENIYGKTTLSQILNSQNNGNISTLTKKKSIPISKGCSQLVEQAYYDGEKIHNIKFDGIAWENNVAAGKIMVYDNDFIHNNLMLGNKIDRSNKEKFTDFIIGESGVQLVKEIESINEKIKKVYSQNKNPDFVRNEKPDIVKAFVDLNVSEDIEQLNKQKSVFESRAKALEESKRLQSLSVPTIIPLVGCQSELQIKINELNELLIKEYDDVSDEVTKIVLDHIKDATTEKNGVKQWISDGFIKFKKNNVCPMCGQSTNGLNLFVALERLFTAKYKEYLDSIKVKVNELLAYDFQHINFYSLITQCITNIRRYEKYDPELDSIIEQMDHEKVRTTEQELNELIKVFVKNMKSLCEEKKTNPTTTMQPITIDVNIELKCIELQEHLATINTSLTAMIVKINGLRSSIEKTEMEISQDIEVLQKELYDCKRKISRVLQNEQCYEYIVHQKIIEGYKTKLKGKRKELEDNQSTFLDEFFLQMNTIYTQLGNSDITLELKTDERGNKKIFFIRIKFKGHELKEGDISELMSESERRSLSLAIFLTKVMQNQNKEDIIIVLDDPVVSYDDNRVGNTINLILTLHDKFRQVIVLSHYKYFVKKIIGINGIGMKSFRIERDKVTARLVDLNEQEFCLSSIEQLFVRIQKFIDRESSDNVKPLLRILLERFIKIRYQKQIFELNLTKESLFNVIKGIEPFFTADIYKKLQYHRTILNPESHDYDELGTDENVRNLASDLINDLYRCEPNCE